MKRTLPLSVALAVVLVVLMIVNLLIGSVKIPVNDVCKILVGSEGESEIWQNIIWKSRLPQVLTAIVAGAGLAVSGLQMQTVFRNPLAGPSVLGISNGSALGVAFVALLSGKIGGVALSQLGYLGDAAMSVAAIVGALAVMLLIVWIAQKVAGNVTLLIIGVMIGYLANAIIGVLKFLSPDEDVKAFASVYRACRLKGGDLSVVLRETHNAISTKIRIEDEVDTRELLEAIREDDGVRYSMEDVMSLVREGG